MAVIKNKSTERGRKFWEHVETIAAAAEKKCLCPVNWFESKGFHFVSCPLARPSKPVAESLGTGTAHDGSPVNLDREYGWRDGYAAGMRDAEAARGKEIAKQAALEAEAFNAGIRALAEKLHRAGRPVGDRTIAAISKLV